MHSTTAFNELYDHLDKIHQQLILKKLDETPTTNLSTRMMINNLYFLGLVSNDHYGLFLLQFHIGTACRLLIALFSRLAAGCAGAGNGQCGGGGGVYRGGGVPGRVSAVLACL